MWNKLNAELKKPFFATIEQAMEKHLLSIYV